MALLGWQVPVADRAEGSLRKHGVFLCSACTGAGKTYIALECANRLNAPTLVIAPKVSITQWWRAAEQMGAKDRIIAVINKEQVNKKSGCEWYNRVDRWRLPENTLVVWDEIHQGASGIDSYLTDACAYLKHPSLKGVKLLAMSATVADSPLKLRALGFWMGFFRPYTVISSFYRWCERHGCGRRPMFRGGRTQWIFDFTSSKTKGREYMSGIAREMGERFLTMTPDQIPGFPEEERDVMRIDLAEKDRKALEQAYAEMPPKLKDLPENEMTQLLRLQQRAEWCKAQALAELAVTDVAENGFSVLVLVNFRDALKRIAEHLDAKKVGYALIYGAQDPEERQSGIDAFQRNEIHVVVATMKAASCSLSLHDERHERMRVSYISPGYNAADVVQGLGRIRRVGGTKAVQHLVLAANTVEDRVADKLERKIGNIEALNDRDLER